MLKLGRHNPCWFDTPHAARLDCGLMMETTTRTFLCGDLFTQGGAGETALIESDILGPSEAFRADGLLQPCVEHPRSWSDWRRNVDAIGVRTEARGVETAQRCCVRLVVGCMKASAHAGRSARRNTAKRVPCGETVEA